MKLIIDIYEEDYNNIEPFLNGETIKGGFNLFKTLEIIKNGTPLPKVPKMREATAEELESVNNYIKSISKPTCVNFWDDSYRKGCRYSDRTESEG